MALKDFFAREKHVALNAQPRGFRIAKWLVILLLSVALYVWKGWATVAALLLCLAVVGTSLHFFLRWKTEGWTKSWGPYTRIPLNGE